MAGIGDDLNLGLREQPLDLRLMMGLNVVGFAAGQKQHRAFKRLTGIEDGEVEDIVHVPGQGIEVYSPFEAVAVQIAFQVSDQKAHQERIIEHV